MQAYLLLNLFEGERAFANIQGKVNLDTSQKAGVYFVHLGLVGIIDQLFEQLLMRE